MHNSYCNHNIPEVSNRFEENNIRITVESTMFVQDSIAKDITEDRPGCIVACWFCWVLWHKHFSLSRFLKECLKWCIMSNIRQICHAVKWQHWHIFGHCFRQLICFSWGKFNPFLVQQACYPVTDIKGICF